MLGELAWQEFWDDQMNSIGSVDRLLQEFGGDSDLLRGYPRLVANRVAAEQIDEITCVEDEDRRGLREDPGDGRGDGRHAVDTSSTYRDRKCHWSSNWECNSAAASLGQPAAESQLMNG